MCAANSMPHPLLLFLPTRGYLQLQASLPRHSSLLHLPCQGYLVLHLHPTMLLQSTPPSHWATHWDWEAGSLLSRFLRPHIRILQTFRTCSDCPRACQGKTLTDFIVMALGREIVHGLVNPLLLMTSLSGKLLVLVKTRSSNAS
jgi:hypothetical protein